MVSATSSPASQLPTIPVLGEGLAIGLAGSAMDQQCGGAGEENTANKISASA